MAQRFIGIDLSTRWVRVFEVIAGPRSVAMGAYHEQPIVPSSSDTSHAKYNEHNDKPGTDKDHDAHPDAKDHNPQHNTQDDDWAQRAGAALLAVSSQLQLRSADAIAVGINAPSHISTILTFPFNDPKVIEKILPVEMSSHMPLDDEHITNFMVIGPAAEGGFETMVVASPPKDIETALRALTFANLDPQLVIPDAFSQHRLLPFLYPDAAEVPSLILNLGALYTHCTISQDARLLLSRTLLIGGDAVTAALSQALSVPLEAAESFKCARGFVAPQGQATRWAEQLGVEPGYIGDQRIAPDPIAAAAQSALRPLLLSVRQLLASFTSRTGKRVERIWLTGDGSKLPGLAELLQHDLQIQASPLIPPTSALADLSRAHGLAITTSLALALSAHAASTGSPQINLRQGRLAFRGGFDFLRDHALSFSIIAAVLLAAVVFTIFARFNALSAEHNHVAAELSRLSQDLFGSEAMTAKAVQAKLDGVSTLRAIPERSAYYHLAAMGTYLSDEFFYDPPEDADPTFEPPNFEIRKLIINLTTKNVSIEAAVSPDGALQKFKRALSSYRCFPANLEEIEQTNDIEIPTYTRVKFVFTTLPNCTGE